LKISHAGGPGVKLEGGGPGITAPHGAPPPIFPYRLKDRIPHMWLSILTLWRSLLPLWVQIDIKHFVPDRVQPSFLIFDIRARASECPNIKNYKLRLNPVWQRCFISLYPYGNSGRQRVNHLGGLK